MTRRRKCIVCEGWFSASGDERICPVDQRWNDRQQSSQYVRRVVGTPGHSGTERDAVIRGEVTARVPAHPSGARTIAFPCFAHDFPSALNCPTCIANGERDWELREERAL